MPVVEHECRAQPAEPASSRGGAAAHTADLPPELANRPGRAERAWSAAELAVDRLVGARLNPLAQSGPLAVLCFALALLSGVYLFLVYDVTAPYQSVQALGESPLGVAMRGLHRYTSRGFALFTLIHVVRMAVGGRFRGPRWLAWETGFAQVAIGWFVAVTGYVLIWDEQAQVLLAGLVRPLDAATVFVQPFALTLLADSLVRDNLFFITLFLHLSVPVASGIAFWLHVSRLSRPALLPPRLLLALTVVGFLALSLALPARSGPPADLSRLPDWVALDPWFNLVVPVLLVVPLPLLTGGGLLLTAVLLALPWLGLRRPRRPVARVVPARCTGCALCAQDCPYGAIALSPRPAADNGANGEPSAAGGGPTPRALVAEVSDSRCVGCGICLGSCSFGGIELVGQAPAPVEPEAARAGLAATTLKADVARVLAAPAAGGPPLLAVTCRWPGQPELGPGVRWLEVPCAGAVHRDLVGHALDAGAAGVLVTACPAHLCAFREGARWSAERARRERRPAWSSQAATRARLVEMLPGDLGGLRRAVEELRRDLAGGRPAAAVPARGGTARWRLLAGTLLLAVLVAATAWDARVQLGAGDGGLLKVALRTEAPLAEARAASAEEQEKLLPHMRSEQPVGRERVPLRFTVQLDGEVVLDETYRARGFRQDGPTYGYTEVAVGPGERALRVTVEDASGSGKLRDSWEGRVQIEPGRVRVVSYGALGTGFTVR